MSNRIDDVMRLIDAVRPNSDPETDIKFMEEIMDELEERCDRVQASLDDDDSEDTPTIKQPGKA